MSDERPAGDKVVNPQDDGDLETTIRAADKVTESNTLGVELTAGVEEIVHVSVTTRYERTWTKDHEFSQDITTKVPPHMKVWFTHQAPIIRDTGNFTVTLGNTTWHLNDVSFETPDWPNPANQGQYIRHEAPATQEDLAYANAHAHLGYLVELP